MKACGTSSHTALSGDLIQRGLASDEQANGVQQISTRATARWACNVAAGVISWFLSIAPASDFSPFAGAIYTADIFARVD
jgi:hypothetical protein